MGDRNIMSDKIRKGMRVRLTSGREGVMLDDKVKCYVRLANVDVALCPEAGGVSMGEVLAALVDGAWHDVTLTESHAKKAQKQSEFWEMLDGTSAVTFFIP